jgi:hypothetical protein
MDSPSMANSHGRQGLDKRHLPDRCIVESTPYFIHGMGALSGTLLWSAPYSGARSLQPAGSSWKWLPSCCSCHNVQDSPLSFTCASTWLRRRLPAGVKATRTVPGWIGVLVEEGDVWSPAYAGVGRTWLRSHAACRKACLTMSTDPCDHVMWSACAAECVVSMSSGQNHNVIKCVVVCIHDPLCAAGRYYAYLWDKTCANKMCIQVQTLRG